MGWNYKASLTYDHTKCGIANSASFPSLVYGSDNTIKDIANGGYVQSGVGNDILFFSDSALTIQIPSEIEFYDNVNGILWIWVNINTLDHITDGVIYIAVGNVAPPARLGGVWDVNFKGVWHLPNGTVLNAADSTGVNNGIIAGPTASGGGKVDGGASYINAADNIDVGNNASLQFVGNQNYTISAWVNPTTFGGNSRGTIFNGIDYLFRVDNSGVVNGLSITNNVGGSYAYSNANCMVTGVLQFVVVTWDGANAAFYVNGVNKGSPAYATLIGGAAANRYIGWRNPSDRTFNGILDEVRVSSIVRSTSWITASYNNQNSPGNIGIPGFWTWGGWINLGVSNTNRRLTGVGI